MTLTIGALALVLAVAAGVPLGFAAALGHDGPVDHAVTATALLGLAVPGFVLAPVLALAFGVHLGWLPVAGWEPGSVRHLVLPVVTLALPFVAYIARLTRGSLLEVLEAPWIRTARAKRLRARLIRRARAACHEHEELEAVRWVSPCGCWVRRCRRSGGSPYGLPDGPAAPPSPMPHVVSSFTRTDSAR